SRRFLNALEGPEHDAVFLLRRHEMEVARIALVVAHALPAELDRVLDNLGIVVAHLAVEGDGPAHAVPGQHIHDAKDAHAVTLADTIVSRLTVDHVGRLALPPRPRPVERKGLDIRDDTERHPSAVWPRELGSAVDRYIVERSIALRLHKPLLPFLSTYLDAFS